MKALFSILTIFIWCFWGPNQAQADSACDAAKRELAFGEAAAEDAKDVSGFKRAAEQFSAATKKAPNCPQAHFNLGIVQENAGNLSAAKQAYENYLKLVPNASDRGEVEKRVFKLEYRLTQGAEDQKERKEKAAKERHSELLSLLHGRWRPEKRFDEQLCPGQKLYQGILMEFSVTKYEGGHSIIGKAVGSAFRGDNCEVYYTNMFIKPPQNEFFRGALSSNSDVLEGTFYDINMGPGRIIRKNPRNMRININMSKDGRSFTLASGTGVFPQGLLTYYERY